MANEMTRSDAITELASDMVSTAESLAVSGDYETLHAWLQPLFIERLQLAHPTNAALAAFYEAQLGKEIDIAGAESMDELAVNPLNSPALELLRAVLPYAENEAFSLESLKDSPEAEAEAERAWKAIEAAQVFLNAQPEAE